jgi:hypothetical protein
VRTNVISNGIGGEKQGNKRKERIDERESARRIGFRGYRKAGLKKQIHTHTKEPARDAKTINLLILVTFFCFFFFIFLINEQFKAMLIVER